MADGYGAKCHRCAHLDHRGEQAVEPIEWLETDRHQRNDVSAQHSGRTAPDG